MLFGYVINRHRAGLIISYSFIYANLIVHISLKFQVTSISMLLQLARFSLSCRKKPKSGFLMARLIDF